MLANFLFGDWQGTIVLVLAGVAVALSLVYIPSPAKHYAVSACLIAAVALKLYSMGFSARDATCKAEFNAAMDKINIEGEKAIVAAVEKAKAEGEANVATVKRVLDDQAAQAAKTEAGYKALLDEIAAAGADADKPAPGLILDAIGAKK